MSQKRTKTDNAHIEWKVALRREAVKNLDRLKVLDLFAGRNLLWKSFDLERYYGIEIVKGKGKNLFADNLRVIPSLDLSGFTVIDCDSYGSSIKQIRALFSNPTLRPGTVVLFTEIHSPRDGLPNDMVKDSGLTEIYRAVPSAFQKYGWEMFLGMLHDLGIQSVRCYELVENSHIKHYGYFVVPDPSKCANVQG